MATRSTISLLLADDSIDMIYCHWDGYLAGVGATLLENYNTDAQVRELIAQGDVSSLADTIEDTEFYARDRGETGCEAENTDIMEAEHAQEYNYVWANGEWLVCVAGEWHHLAYLLQSEIEDIWQWLAERESTLA